MNWHINGPLILGNSRWSHWTNSWELHREFSDLWSTGFVDSESGKSSFHAGVAETVSKQNYNDHYLRYSHNCFGCPETEIWTDSLLSFDNVTISDNGSSITVNANVSGCNICACSGDKGSAFWQIENDVSSYTFYTSVRPLYITITKHNYAPYTAVTGGTFTSDEYWFGNLHVLGDVTITSGATLSILDDTKVKVNAGYALTVHGKIEADDATFQSSGSGRWYGIDVDGSSSSYIKNCQIKDCDYGIIVGGNCAMSIKKNDIQAHYTGIRITEDSNPWIEDCYIQAKTIAPIITTGNGDGVVMRCNLGSTTLYNGPYYGHENMGSGSTCFNYQMCGRNKFESNIVYIGVCILGGYPTYAYGYNWIERPAYTTPYHVYNASGHSIGAQNNYWGGTDPLVGGYTVYYQPVLGSAPDPVGPSWSLSKEVTNVLYRAWQAYRENDYAGAKELAKSAFQSHRSDNQSAEALFLAMKSAYREGMLAGEEGNLQSLLKDRSLHHTVTYEAVRWLMKLNLYRGETRKALDLALSVPDTSLFGREILLDLGVDLLEKRKDMDEAVKVFNIMTNKYQDEETKTVKENILAFHQSRPAKPPKTQPQSKTTVAESGNLLQVYPNPFNLSTTITYHLAEPVFVKIIIYDLLGREINTLISGRMENGSHDIIWDGKDA